MVAQHTPFEYEPTDSGMRRVERARLTFKPSRELADKLEAFILPSKRRQALGLHGLILYSNYSWVVNRDEGGKLIPPDSLADEEIRRLRQEALLQRQKMKLTRFVVFKELGNVPTTMVGLKVSLSEDMTQEMYNSPHIPNGLLSRDSIPVRAVFSSEIAVPPKFQGTQRTQLQRLVLGDTVPPSEPIDAGDSPNADAHVTDMKLALSPPLRKS